MSRCPAATRAPFTTFVRTTAASSSRGHRRVSRRGASVTWDPASSSRGLARDAGPAALHEGLEIARHVGANEGVVVADDRVGHEDHGQVVALAAGALGDKLDGRLVARHVEPLPGEALGAEELLDPRELADVAVLLEVDEHRCGLDLGAAGLGRSAPPAGAKLGQALARPRARRELVPRREGAAQGHVEAPHQVLRRANRQERVAAGRRDGPVERVAYAFEHGAYSALNPAMYESAKQVYRQELARIRDAGLEKVERALAGPQGATIRLCGGPPGSDGELVNFCSNNYLGLSSDAIAVQGARAALSGYGFGLSSVRFICGTQDLHRELERRVSAFLGTEDTILYSSCFDANGGLFETLLDERDAVISDALNHASIIDGIRLCKAQRYRYANNSMAELEECLKQASGARTRLIATDGVFSMDGIVANLPGICDLADRYDALVMVDDSHATGFMGAHGRGTPEHCGVAERIDILTGTLGKALGGASGGYTAARREVIEWLRQRSRPYLFSNSIPPVVAAASLAVLDLLEESPGLRTQLFENAQFFRAGLSKAGFE